MIGSRGGVLLALACLLAVAVGEQCVWNSLAGATFDLRPLRVENEAELSYHIYDGDIPCTEEHEYKYNFAWNFCHDVTKASDPTHDNGKNICENNQKGAAIQFMDRVSDGYKECHVIGRYDPAHENSEFSLLSSHDPAAGVSMTYPLGEKCPHGILRSATIDVQCANIRMEVDSALEPSPCAYHMVMKSWHGCPTECPVTDAGLCSSHGHCHYDDSARQPYCYCNEGYAGDACEESATSALHSSGMYKLQVFLLVVLLLAAVLLVLVVLHMVKKVKQFRSEQAYSHLDGSEHEISFNSNTEMTSTTEY